MKRFLLVFTVILLMFSAAACSKKVYLEDYITECKYNILAGEAENFTLRASLSVKENPYYVDGNVGKTANIMEIYLIAPDNTQSYTVMFEDGGKNYGGQLNYNGVKKRHELSFSYSNENLSALDFVLTYGEESLIIKTVSVISGDILSPQDALMSLKQSKPEFFENMTTDGAFGGEIHIRLLEEGGKCYYYIGLIDTQGKIFAFLVDAEDARVIAQKEINYRTRHEGGKNYNAIES